jgi:hypothetical protein
MHNSVDVDPLLPVLDRRESTLDCNIFTASRDDKWIGTFQPDRRKRPLPS